METFSALLSICVGIHRSSVNFPYKGQWRGALMISLICAWVNGWVNNGKAGDLRRHRSHYDATVMYSDKTQPDTMENTPWAQHQHNPSIRYCWPCYYHHGIRGSALGWFDNHLIHKYQYLYNNNTSSDMKHITCGVPQESILDPVLFLLYIFGDIRNQIYQQFHKFGFHRQCCPSMSIWPRCIL